MMYSAIIHYHKMSVYYHKAGLEYRRAGLISKAFTMFEMRKMMIRRRKGK